MSVRERNRINAANFTQKIDGILGTSTWNSRNIKSRVRHSHNDIGTLTFHDRNKFLGCLCNILSDECSFQINLVPFHNLRSHEPKNPYLNLMRLVITIH